MSVARTISPEEARRFYDRIGSWLDSQSFYEDEAISDLVDHASFGSAEAVFELGCGTGRFAEALLREHLSETASYRGCDLSPKMVSLAGTRLESFGERARIILSSGGAPAAEPADSCDRFVSNYVLDLLSESDIRAVVSEASRMLRPGGLLCVASLSFGCGRWSRGFMGFWARVHALSPKLVGGCRPIDLPSFLGGSAWSLLHHESFSAFGVSSEVVIAACRASA